MHEARHPLARTGASVFRGGSLPAQRLFLCGCLALLCIAPRNGAQAAFAQATLSGMAGDGRTAVSVWTTPVDFGEIFDSGRFSGHGVVVVTAPTGSPFAIALGAGAHYAAGARHLRRLQGSETIPYALSSDASGALSWGDSDFYGTFPAPSMHGIGTGRPVPMTVFGEISVSPPLPAGRYADQILVSIFF